MDCLELKLSAETPVKRFGLMFSTALAMIAADAGASCGSSFCSVDTHWDTQGLTSDEGLRVDLRASFARADRWRAGASRKSLPPPTGSDEEIEDRRTLNRLVNLDAEYAINARWNVALGLPLAMRSHSHTFDSSVTGPFAQRANFTAAGDIRLLGKYKFEAGSLGEGSGIRFGLKLPTGGIRRHMTPPDPAAPGVPYALERSGQPGSGSTDAILGAYYFRTLPEAGWGWFASAQAQSALATRDRYRPGNELKADLGLHYALTPELTALLQLNLLRRARDSGANANPASGGHSVSLSPGLSLALSPQTQVYGIAQFVLRQYVNKDPADPASGQLTAPWSVALGISHRF